MGLDNLVKEIQQSAISEERKIRQEADAEADKILAQAKAEAQKVKAKGEAETLDAVAREKTALAGAEINASKNVFHARAKLVEQAVENAKVKAIRETVNSPSYPQLFEAFAKEAFLVVGKSARIQCSKKDLALAKKLFPLIEAQECQCAGGLIAVSVDGRLRADNTIDSQFAQQEDRMRAKAFEMLFGKISSKSAFKPATNKNAKNAVAGKKARMPEKKQKPKPQKKPASKRKAKNAK